MAEFLAFIVCGAFLLGLYSLVHYLIPEWFLGFILMAGFIYWAYDFFTTDPQGKKILAKMKDRPQPERNRAIWCAILLLGGGLLYFKIPLHMALLLLGAGILWVSVSFCNYLYASNRTHILRLERELEALRALITPPPPEPPPFRCSRCNSPLEEDPRWCEYCGGSWECCCTCNRVAHFSPTADY